VTAIEELVAEGRKNMFDTIETLVINSVIAILSRLIKNPASTAKEKTIIAHIAQVATDADTATNGTIWSKS
jgi:hypothetical protein